MSRHNMPSTYIIAEAGVNHNGSEAKALELIDIAQAGGANAVKFQMFSPEALVTGTAATAAYQARNLHDDAISQQAMLRALTLPNEAYIHLQQHCLKRGLDFLCTPFDHGSLEYLTTRTKMRYLKLASGEVTNGPLLLAAARTGLPIILSTGMSELDEIGIALGILHYGYTHVAGFPTSLSQPDKSMLDSLRKKVVLLHCVSQYPASAAASNLRAMETLATHFGLPVGFSDHSRGITLAVAAVARGAAMVEKHFTYDVKAPGPDHAASLSPEALKQMIAAIRDVEQGLGDGKKTCQLEEENTRAVARRSVVAASAIAKGEIFSERNLACKRPGTGALSPNRLWALLGKPSKRRYAADDFIAADEVN